MAAARDRPEIKTQFCARSLPAALLVGGQTARPEKSRGVEERHQRQSKAKDGRTGYTAAQGVRRARALATTTTTPPTLTDFAAHVQLETGTNPRPRLGRPLEKPGFGQVMRQDLRLRVDEGGKPARDGDVAQTLRDAVTLFRADMILMGGYVHSRLREMIFGGVTQSLLKTSPVPLLMSY